MDWSDYLTQLGIDPDNIEAGAVIDVTAPQPSPEPEPKPQPRPQKPTTQSALEAAFDVAWQRYGDPAFHMEREYIFHDARNWRIDRAFPDQQVAVEIDGGVWDQGRHTRAIGYMNDCEKLNALVEAGWALIRIPGPWLRRGQFQRDREVCEQIVRVLQGRS